MKIVNIISLTIIFCFVSSKLNLYIALISLIFLVLFIQPCFAIKIGLQTNVNKTYIGASTKAEIIDCRTNKLIFIMDEMKGYEFKP